MWVLKQIWITELLKILRSTPEIEKIRTNHDFIKVKFRNTQVTEYWALSEDAYQKYSSRHIVKVPDNPFAGVSRKLKMHRMFESDMTIPEEFELLKEHFIIPRKAIKTSNFINLRIAVHRLTEALGRQGWIQPTYTNEIMQNDFNKLIAEDYTKYQVSMIRYTTSILRRFYGRRLIYNFHEFPKKVRDCWSLARVMRVSIDGIIDSSKPLTRETIIDQMYSYVSPPALISPNYYRAIMSRWFTPNSTILDLTPTASKAIAAIICGLKYHAAKPVPSISKTLEFIGYTQPIDPIYPNYDYIILSMDRVSKRNNADMIAKYGKMGQFIVVVPNTELQFYKSRFNVVRVLRIALTHITHADEDDCLLIIDQR